eukprot:COSAG06_NODE_8965_length_2022_cov_81.252210_1_plen_50_part_10
MHIPTESHQTKSNKLNVQSLSWQISGGGGGGGGGGWSVLFVKKKIVFGAP